MSDDQFTKLFVYIEDFRKDITEKVDTKASQASVDHFVNNVDGLSKEVEDLRDEQAARDAQWERLLEWAREVSKKTGVPLRDL